MVPDAPVKNSAGEEEIIQFLPLVNLRGCSSDATFKGRRAVTHRACDPTQTSTTQQNHRSNLDPSLVLSTAPALQHSTACHCKLILSPQSYGVCFLWLETGWRKGNTLDSVTTLHPALCFTQKIIYSFFLFFVGTRMGTW